MGDVTASVELLVQDGSVPLDPQDVVGGGGRETRELALADDGHDRFLDGPVCRRLAVVDFDPATGALLPPPATFTPFRSNPRSGRYVADGEPASAATIAVNAFGTTFQTVRMFENPGALGRRVRWAFGSEQLLLVPRAGEWANAFYDRDTRSLQFFWFPDEQGELVHTALSRDVVAHECGHALLDAVVPSLYDSSTPQSIAIHEAVADLVAVLMALDSRALREAVLARTGNELSGDTPFNAIAEQFGMARPGPDGTKRTALRDLDHDETLETLAGAAPHVLSTVLSAIYYDTLRAIFAARFAREQEPGRTGRPLTAAAAANKALGTAQGISRRQLLRAIDYLPPGELSFADVGRATLAADRATPADLGAEEGHRSLRDEFARRFVARRVVDDVADLDTEAPDDLSVPGPEVARLHASDWAAYQYVAAHRGLLGIPDDASFTVLPRVDSTKVIGPTRDGVAPSQRELLLKVAWSEAEVATGSRHRVVPTGATIALHVDEGRCLALVRSDVTAGRHREERDRLLSELEHDGHLADPGRDDVGLRGSHRLLHLAGWER